MRHVLLLSLPILLSACVSQGEYDGVVAERDALAAKLKKAETNNAILRADRDRIWQQLVDTKNQLAQVQSASQLKALGLKPGQKLSATLQTTSGDIHCELWPEVAPITVANFVGLSEGTKEWTDPNTGKKRTDPLYDGTIFHRVIPNFMIQGGDPLGNGRGGPGYAFQDEFSRTVTFSEPGILAMANAGPSTNGSQFFITDGTPAHLNGKHTIFGKCADMDVVRGIINAPVDDSRMNRPIAPVSVKHIAISRG